MKKYLLTILVVFCVTQMVFPQEDGGVVALDLPIRNSLVFNRYAINPTFSFVRQQNKFISINNKREWVQFENAPETYLASYSGRFAENIGAGLAVFQQNYGVLTTFGGLLNFAYNVRLNQDSNLTFGLNVGAYKSGINTANVVTNFDDPSLQNVASNFLLTVNPGINYGTEFLDFGISVNNLVLYNLETSMLIEDNPKQGIQAHVMHSGYFNGRGFFDDTKFTAMLRSEFRTDETIISGLAMLNVPKGLWLQVGYNNVYGVSGGLGLNLTQQIALEYNIEKSIGELVEFGSSHDITLAYRFITNKKYKYNGDDKVSGLFSKKRKRKPVTEASKAELEGIRERAAERRAQAKLDMEAKREAKIAAKDQAKLDAKEKAQEAAEVKARLLEEKKAKLEADKITKAQEAADAQAKLVAAQKAQEAADAQAKLVAEQKAQEAADAQAKLVAEQKAQEAADAQAKLVAEQKAQEAADAQAKLVAEQKAQEEADAQAKLVAEQKAQEAADAQAKLVAEQKAQEAADAQAKLVAEQKAQEAADAQAKLVAEQKAQEAADAQAKLVAEQKAQEAAEAQAKLVAAQKAQEAADAQAKLVAAQKAQEAADAQAKLVAEQKAQEAADAQVKDELISNPKDQLGQSMKEVAKLTEDSKVEQNELLKEFDDLVKIKDKDLKDLKEENDLSDQGIAVKPRPFKSITAENNKLNAIKSDLDQIIKTRNNKIKELNDLYEERMAVESFKMDPVNLYYKKEIKRLESEQLKTVQTKAILETQLNSIKAATEFEKRRRIKRADFDNEEDRYAQDRAMLQNIKRTTVLRDTPLKSEDFDFGEEQSNNIQILKNIKNVENGYYLIIAVHNDIERRNNFVTKVIASGRTDVDFFYDVNTSKFYIYYDKFDNINQANEAMEAKGSRPYNIKMSLVKIENQ
jgi:type IX secretion system PorP/SprF family membrane protein